MYKIAMTSYGFYITFEGILTESEMLQFAAELETLRPAVPKSHSAIVDVRKLIPPESRVLDLLHEAMVRAKVNGTERVAIIGSSPVIKNQAVQLVFLSNLANIARYFNASKIADWEKLSLDWVANGIEPTFEAPANTCKMHEG